MLHKIIPTHIVYATLNKINNYFIFVRKNLFQINYLFWKNGQLQIENFLNSDHKIHERDLYVTLPKIQNV